MLILVKKNRMKSLIKILLLILPMSMHAQTVVSRLEIYDVNTDRREVIHEEVGTLFEAPNWSQDGKFLIYNQGGNLYKFDLDKKKKEKINTGFAQNCNNDHGISPDGKMLAISNNDSKIGSRIYTLPIEGGLPNLITKEGSSYWHGWSPDGESLVYCAERGGNYDIYRINCAGGEEQRLTYTEGLDDGPDYSFSGRHIYFNSVRTGSMQIWRMDADGSNQKQLSNDGFNDWFPHPSPDGTKVVFLSYIDAIDPGSHPPFKKVMLRILNPDTKIIYKLFELFGGQGTLNVPSWSPDSKRFAFVSYALIDNKE
jgi:TolB protein